MNDLVVNEEVRTLTVEDWNSEEDIEAKKFYVERYWHSGKESMFNTIEECRDYVNKQINKNPFGTGTFYIVELKEAHRAVPQNGIKVESLVITNQLENKQDEL